ncbi:MAG: NFACT family protein [Armatimonadetes bacterium]|nr:NFACT family protein [Armatimonadota bacterium]
MSRIPAPAFDSLVLRAVTAEIASLAGGRVTRVWQPAEEEILLAVRTRAGTRHLLCSIHARWARVHLVAARADDGAAGEVTFPFHQFLRRRLADARMIRIEQPLFERTLTLTCETLDGEAQLIAEIMGRHSNLILVRDGVIAGALKPVTSAMSRARQVLPGRRYTPPPAPPHPRPPEVTAEGLAASLRGHPGLLWRALVEGVLGISPPIAHEIAYRAGFDPSMSPADVPAAPLAEALHRIAADAEAGRFAPTLYLDAHGDPAAFAPFPLAIYAHLTPVPAGMSEAVDRFHRAAAPGERLEQQRRSVVAVIKEKLGKVERGLAEARAQMAEAAEAGRLRKMGELLLAYQSQVPTRAAAFTAPGYDDPAEEMVIPLDPARSPVQNAQRYFRRYAKLQAVRKALPPRIAVLESEQAYLGAVRVHLEHAAGGEDLAAIRRELEEEGYLRTRRRAARGAAPAARPQPRTFRTPDGFTILAGRSGRENDHLTFKVAGPDDLWFHARGIPGAHVILRDGGRRPSREAILSAAGVAAYFSQARESGKVAVDHTARRYVRKPPGSRPGTATYTREETVTVEPRLPETAAHPGTGAPRNA